MALLDAIPCCGHDMLYGIFAAYTAFVFPRKHKYNELHLKIWPVRERAKFLLRAGYGSKAFAHTMLARDYMRDLEAASEGDKELVDLIAEMRKLEPGAHFADNARRLKNRQLLKRCATRTRLPSSRGNTSMPLGDCVNRFSNKVQAKGSHSLTMLRHPFPRAISSYFYKGHNPNHDAFQLRPGEWFNPETRPKGHTTRLLFDVYVDAPEYQNTLVKLFGDSRGCRKARACDKTADEEERNFKEARQTIGCLLQAGACHAYRNATLSVQNLHAAIENIRDFRFFGIQEAYNTSILLLGRTFPELEILETDFEATRVSDMKTKACSGFIRRELQRNGTWCRRVMEANWLDVQFYEASHRIFCERLKQHGLLRHPIFLREKEQSTPWLCTKFDASSSEQYCGLLDRPAVVEERAIDKAGCRKWRLLKPVW